MNIWNGPIQWCPVPLLSRFDKQYLYWCSSSNQSLLFCSKNSTVSCKKNLCFSIFFSFLKQYGCYRLNPCMGEMPRPATLIWHKIWMNVRKIWIYRKESKIALFIRKSLPNSKPKIIWSLNQLIWISLKFRQKIWMIQIKSEWMAGLNVPRTLGGWSLYASQAVRFTQGLQEIYLLCYALSLCRVISNFFRDEMLPEDTQNFMDWEKNKCQCPWTARLKSPTTFEPNQETKIIILWP